MICSESCLILAVEKWGALRKSKVLFLKAGLKTKRLYIS